MDENVSPVVARELQAHLPDLDVAYVTGWRDGLFAGQSDGTLLRAAHAEQRVLVTYDKSTIPDVISSLIAHGEEHSGVVFVDRRTIAPDNFGGLVRALAILWTNHQHDSWVNRTVFLKRDQA